jgi:hypothetical protein
MKPRSILLAILASVLLGGCDSRAWQPAFAVTGRNIGTQRIEDSGAEFVDFYHLWGYMDPTPPLDGAGKKFSDYRGPYPDHAKVWWTINGRHVVREIPVSTERPLVPKDGDLELVIEIDGENVRAKWVAHPPLPYLPRGK